jgi:hypothetical protein
MVRTEMTGVRSLGFSGWIRENLPDTQTGYGVTNIDWVFWNYKTRVLLLAEEKTHGGHLRNFLARLMSEVIDPALKAFCPTVGIVYLGFHVVRFENETPADGKIWWDNEELTEAGLKDRLTF